MKSDPHIFIIGAGAIGKVLSVILKNQGKQVTLLRGSVNDLSPYEETITVDLIESTQITGTINVSAINNFPLIDGIVLLTNKSFGNPQLANQLKGKTGNSPIIFLQNGLNIEQPFIDRGFPELYRCVLFATSQPVNEHSYRFRPVNPSPIGVIRGTDSNLQSIITALDNIYFPFQLETSIQPIIWKKAIVNSVFNSVCPLLEIDNGVFHRNDAARAIAQTIISECIEVAALKEINLDPEDVMNTLLRISKASDGQLISTYQDILNKRPTEIETLNLAIAGIASETKREELTRTALMLGQLVKLKAGLFHKV